ncbi:MAG: hypothetical protein BGO01_04770 [Armatimonadetes bacterium 55-13]|nr:hypothetical protein [Armatimonadota bacterium]OJU61405.1 MAG: hypothetical protein BGO01_04770 [Armatimonadetes bacterium 55-13]
MRISFTSILILLAASLLAQQNPMPMGMLNGKASVAMRGEVKGELQLTPEQQTRSQREVDAIGSVPVAESASGMLGPLERLDANIKPILSDDQWKRLTELWIQFEGPFVLQSPEIADALKLDDEVRKKISDTSMKYTAWWRKEIAKVRKSADLGRIRGEARKVSGKLLGFLNKAQREQFSKMEGQKFRFQT